MALEKVTVVNKIEVLESGHVQVRMATRVLEDGVQLGSDMYHRTTYEPGEELPPDVDRVVQEIAAVVWTPDVVKAHEDAKAAAIAAALAAEAAAAAETAVSVEADAPAR